MHDVLHVHNMILRYRTTTYPVNIGRTALHLCCRCTSDNHRSSDCSYRFRSGRHSNCSRTICKCWSVHSFRLGLQSSRHCRCRILGLQKIMSVKMLKDLNETLWSSTVMHPVFTSVSFGTFQTNDRVLSDQNATSLVGARTQFTVESCALHSVTVVSFRAPVAIFARRVVLTNTPTCA